MWDAGCSYFKLLVQLFMLAALAGSVSIRREGNGSCEVVACLKK